MESREKYIPKLKEKVLEQLSDLTDKIENEEPFPHGNIDIDTLCEIKDELDRILNNWYY